MLKFAVIHGRPIHNYALSGNGFEIDLSMFKTKKITAQSKLFPGQRFMGWAKTEDTSLTHVFGFVDESEWVYAYHLECSKDSTVISIVRIDNADPNKPIRLDNLIDCALEKFNTQDLVEMDGLNTEYYAAISNNPKSNLYKIKFDCIRVNKNDFEDDKFGKLYLMHDCVCVIEKIIVNTMRYINNLEFVTQIVNLNSVNENLNYTFYYGVHNNYLYVSSNYNCFRLASVNTIQIDDTSVFNFDINSLIILNSFGDVANVKVMGFEKLLLTNKWETD